MAVPRRKHSRSRRDKRKSQQALNKKPGRSLCPNCGEVKPPHEVCPKCGHYKDREVVDIHEV